jgi:hypothetical protein
MQQVLSRNVDIFLKSKIRYFYLCCILEKQHMLIVIFIVSKNFIPDKFVRLHSTYIRLRTCYIYIYICRKERLQSCN